MTAPTLHTALTERLDGLRTTAANAEKVADAWEIVPDASRLSIRQEGDDPGFYTEVAIVEQVDWLGQEDGDWVSAVAQHIVNNDPRLSLRRLDAEARVLDRHKPFEYGPADEYPHGACSRCTGSDEEPLDFPCAEILDLAARLGIPVSVSTG